MEKKSRSIKVSRRRSWPTSARGVGGERGCWRGAPSFLQSEIENEQDEKGVKEKV